MQELEETGTFTVTPEMAVSIIDGQHRLAGLFLCNDQTLQSVEMPVIFMLDVSVPIAAKLFQHINGKQQKVNKSVIFDLFDEIPEEQINDKDDLETKYYHTICVSFDTDPRSPLYRQIKMLGTGGGAVSQSFFIDTCKRELKCFRDVDIQRRYDSLYDYFETIQKFFPEDWPKPRTTCTDAEVDAYSQHVLKDRRSQLAKTNGMAAMLRMFNWLTTNRIDSFAIQALVGEVDWTDLGGTGAAAQTHLYNRLKEIIEYIMVLDD